MSGWIYLVARRAAGGWFHGLRLEVVAAVLRHPRPRHISFFDLAFDAAVCRFAAGPLPAPTVVCPRMNP
jgi:hypothetical protein